MTNDVPDITAGSAVCDAQIVAIDLRAHYIPQKNTTACASMVSAARNVHILPNKGRAAGGAVPEANTVRFVLAVATRLRD